MLPKSTKASLFGSPKPADKPRTPLARTGPLKRTHGLAKRSAGAKAAAAPKLAPGPCFTCGRWTALDRSHVLPQGMNQALKAHPLNSVGECRACHTLWGERLTDYARRYPDALAAKVALMQRVCRQRWAFWMMKNEGLLTISPLGQS